MEQLPHTSILLLDASMVGYLCRLPSVVQRIDREEELSELRKCVSDLESRSDDDRLIGQLQRKLTSTKARPRVVLPVFWTLPDCTFSICHRRRFHSGGLYAFINLPTIIFSLYPVKRIISRLLIGHSLASTS